MESSIQNLGQSWHKSVADPGSEEGGGGPWLSPKILGVNLEDYLKHNY